MFLASQWAFKLKTVNKVNTNMIMTRGTGIALTGCLPGISSMDIAAWQYYVMLCKATL